MSRCRRPTQRLPLRTVSTERRDVDISPVLRRWSRHLQNNVWYFVYSLESQPTIQVNFVEIWCDFRCSVRVRAVRLNQLSPCSKLLSFNKDQPRLGSIFQSHSPPFSQISSVIPAWWVHETSPTSRAPALAKPQNL